MILPVKKCYYLLKVSLLLVIVVAVLAFFEKWRGGKRGANAYGRYVDENTDSEFERQIQEDEALIIPGLGEEGRPAYLEGEDKRLGEESEKKLAINVHLSDRISYNRTLQDARNEACKRIVYDAELPSASVVIIFHNEPYSVVLRTVWSVLNSVRRDQPWYRKANYIDRHGKRMTLGYPDQDPTSPYVYLKEIILVDDNSTLPELRGKLDYYVRTRLTDLVRIIRLPESRGVARAREAGARAATGSALVFLDAHCEPQTDWLRPLLARLATSPHSVVTPIIDVIDASTLGYSRAEPANHFEVGGFEFSGHFTWIDVPEREKRRRGADTAPTWSPTMAGGLFAMDREYFWELGAYDEQMSGWGGENLEMSFRIWQCGGTLETIPCSRAGHVFRSFHPYAAAKDSHAANTARAAEVWMDRYKELYYLWRPDLRKNPSIGDVTHRKVLREKLKCKSFQWYLDHIYPEKYVPVRDTTAFGRFRNPASNLCLDSLQRSGPASALGLYPCHAKLQPAQMYGLADTGTGTGVLRSETACATVPHQREPSSDSRRVLMVNCRPSQKSSKWQFLPSKQLRHEATGLCLSTRAAGNSEGEVVVEACDDSPQQEWRPDLVGDTLDDSGGEDIISKDHLSELRKLMHRRPIKGRTRRGAPSKRRTLASNKFVLRLQRQIANGTQHVEAHILCPHEKLFANNTLVRDMVQILNRHDIQVINNGRVFDKNGVTALEEWEKLHPLYRPRGVTHAPHHKATARFSAEDPGSVPAPRQRHRPSTTKRPHKSYKKHKRKHSRATTTRESEFATEEVTRAPRHRPTPVSETYSLPKPKSRNKPMKPKKSRQSSDESEKTSTKVRHSDEIDKPKLKKSKKFDEIVDTSKKIQSSDEIVISSDETEKSKTRHTSNENEEKSIFPKKSKQFYEETVKSSIESKKTRHSDEVESKAFKSSERSKGKKSTAESDFKSPKRLRPSSEERTELPPADSKSNEVWRVGVSRFRVVQGPRAPKPRAQSQETTELGLDVNYDGDKTDHSKTQRSGSQPAVARPPAVLVQGNITFELDDFTMNNFRADDQGDEETVVASSAETSPPPRSASDSESSE